MPTPVTQDDLKRYEQALNRGDRAGFYLDYYNKNESAQLVSLAQVSSFSGVPGDAAMLANDIDAKLASNYPKAGVEAFSLIIARNVYRGVKENVDAGGNGLLADRQILDIAQNTWKDLNLAAYFPGNALAAEALLTGNLPFFQAHMKDLLTPGAAVGAFSGALAISSDADLQNNQNYMQNLRDFQTDLGFSPAPPAPQAPGVTDKASQNGQIKWQVGVNGNVIYGSVKTRDDLHAVHVPDMKQPLAPVGDHHSDDDRTPDPVIALQSYGGNHPPYSTLASSIAVVPTTDFNQKAASSSSGKNITLKPDVITP